MLAWSNLIAEVKAPPSHRLIWVAAGAGVGAITPALTAQRLEVLTVLEQTGHMAPLERPAAVTDALVEFSDGIRNAKQPFAAGPLTWRT
jgi:hypothetical protein